VTVFSIKLEINNFCGRRGRICDEDSGTGTGTCGTGIREGTATGGLTKLDIETLKAPPLDLIGCC
jgi:hypothetical protein